MFSMTLTNPVTYCREVMLDKGDRRVALVAHEVFDWAVIPEVIEVNPIVEAVSKHSVVDSVDLVEHCRCLWPRHRRKKKAWEHKCIEEVLLGPSVGVSSPHRIVLVYQTPRLLHSMFEIVLPRNAK